LKLNKKVGVLAAALIMAGTVAVATPTAQAADGDQLIVGGDFSAPTVNGLLNVPNATSDFSLGDGTLGYGPNNGSMYDPGVYIVGTNPAAVHSAWVNQPAADPQLIVNGFTSGIQKVLEVTVQGEVCTTPGSNITFQFGANMTNILPLSYASDGGAAISVTINGTSIGSEQVLTNDPANIIEIVGAVPAAADGSLNIIIWNSGIAYSGNDFALDDITLTQQGDCEPPCEPTTDGVWHNYTGKFNGPGAPALDDPKWHALQATPGGEHDLAVRGFDLPYNPGKDKGKGDWFVWKDLGTTCPA
jgi:hypothetical protein